MPAMMVASADKDRRESTWISGQAIDTALRNAREESWSAAAGDLRRIDPILLLRSKGVAGGLENLTVLVALLSADC